MDGNDIAYSEHLEFTNDGTDDLLESLVQRQYFLEYQPIFSFHSRDIIGFEALIRLASVKGPIPAHEFVPLAERNGAMDPIGFWALEEAASAAHTLFLLFGENAPFICVNLSIVQLELARFSEKFERALKAFSFPAAHMVLDIDHQVFLSKRPHLSDNIRFLKERGHPIHIDHFDPRLMNHHTCFAMEQVQTVKWSMDVFHLPVRQATPEKMLENIPAVLKKQHIQMLFHKIDQKDVYSYLNAAYPDSWGQGYVLGSPLGFESSLKIYNRHKMARQTG